MQTIDCGSEKKDPDQLIRERWAESLQESLDAFYDPQTDTLGLTRKQLQARLAKVGVEVSLQSIGLWLGGKTAPRPSLQVAVAKVLGAPPRRVFPLEAA